MKTIAQIVGIAAALTPPIASADGSTKAKAGVVKRRGLTPILFLTPILTFMVCLTAANLAFAEDHAYGKKTITWTPNRMPQLGYWAYQLQTGAWCEHGNDAEPELRKNGTFDPAVGLPGIVDVQSTAGVPHADGHAYISLAATPWDPWNGEMSATIVVEMTTKDPSDYDQKNENGRGVVQTDHGYFFMYGGGEAKQTLVGEINGVKIKPTETVRYTTGLLGRSLLRQQTLYDPVRVNILEIETGQIVTSTELFSLTASSVGSGSWSWDDNGLVLDGSEQTAGDSVNIYGLAGSSWMIGSGFEFGASLSDGSFLPQGVLSGQPWEFTYDGQGRVLQASLAADYLPDLGLQYAVPGDSLREGYTYEQILEFGIGGTSITEVPEPPVSTLMMLTVALLALGKAKNIKRS